MIRHVFKIFDKLKCKLIEKKIGEHMEVPDCVSWRMLTVVIRMSHGHPDQYYHIFKELRGPRW